ncbi:MAG TPA: thiol:disulfide interchange protein DsbA/DsbL [Candidatus Desulfobacillus sp.]|nr:thiol:disulfide interchange protein DsbA/DsbL [Candidatus Desulfobacillus sp.]
MRLNKWLGLIGLSLALVAGGALAQGRPAYKLLAKPQPVETGQRIEVIEFFWYGCPHCFDLEPFLRKWTASLPKDVEFRRIPAVPTERWMPNARTFYTLEALGLLDKLHGEVFDAIHIDRVNLNDEKTQLDWMAKMGVDRARFAEAWKSFSVQSKTKRAVQLTQAYDITGVPTLVVDGKYVTSVSMTGSPEGLMQTLDELVARARAERSKKK